MAARQWRKRRTRQKGFGSLALNKKITRNTLVARQSVHMFGAQQSTKKRELTVYAGSSLALLSLRKVIDCSVQQCKTYLTLTKTR